MFKIAIAIGILVGTQYVNAARFAGWDEVPDNSHYKVSHQGPWTIIQNLYQQVAKNDTEWTATPTHKGSHYSFALRKLLKRGGDTYLLGRFNPEKDDFEFTLHADRYCDLGAKLSAPKSLDLTATEINEPQPMKVGHYYYLIVDDFQVLCQILGFDAFTWRKKLGEHRPRLSVRFRYIASEDGHQDLEKKLSQMSSDQVPPSSTPPSPNGEQQTAKDGFSFKALLYAFLLGVFSTLLLIGIYIFKSAKRAGKGFFDFLATGWLGTRGIGAVEKQQGKKKS